MVWRLRKSIISMRQWAYMELGDERAIQFVAMATAEDLKANAEFIRLADSFVEVPAGKNSNNYANVDIIVKVALEQGVDAVWPGWGQLRPRIQNYLLHAYRTWESSSSDRLLLS
jgi:acetyl-CoA carboxylase/biotin carboxylase 1